MALSPAFIRFVERWSRKADAIHLRDDDLAGFFDKFFTLFIIYNRLYAEATYKLWRDGRIAPPDSDALFPDSKAAKQYVADFLDGPTILRSLEADPKARAAIQEMERILADEHAFVVLKGPEAEGCKEDDAELLRRFQSQKPWTRAKAILEFVHTIRCNTFHGSKEYDPVQIPVLRACIAVMSHLNRLLSEKLQETSMA